MAGGESLKSGRFSKLYSVGKEEHRGEAPKRGEGWFGMENSIVRYEGKKKTYEGRMGQSVAQNWQITSFHSEWTRRTRAMERAKKVSLFKIR